MTGAREMLGTVASEPVFDVEELAMVLQTLADLDRNSTVCASEMLAKGNMVHATRAALDCADIAAAAQRVLARGGATDIGVTRAILEATAAAADRCAAECGRHADHHEHCRIHAGTARQAAELCRARIPSLTS